MVRFDAVVVGAGSTGAAAAFQLARHGLRVALVERHALTSAGAHWVNGVAPWMFERAGIALPEPPELRTRRLPFLLHAADGRRGVRIAESPVWQIDMRRLVDRLHRLAVAEGVTLFAGRRVTAMQWAHGRPTALTLVSNGVAEQVGARLFVDATGINGRLRRWHPELHAACPPPAPEDICTAAQQVRRIGDIAAAQEYLARHDAREGDALCFVGVDGGFSTLAVTVDFAHGEVDLLTGALADGRHATGLEIIEAFAAREPWVGEVLSSGSGAIPLRRPYPILAAPGLALVGDSACQVFTAHGSGVGTGLVAARILAEAVIREGDPGCQEAMARYQTAYMREMGKLAAAYDVIRRFSSGLDAAEAAALVASGLTTPAMAAATLAQRMARPRIEELPGLLRGAGRAPRIALRLLPALAKMQATYALYGLYPRGQGRAYRLWLKAEARLSGEAPKPRRSRLIRLAAAPRASDVRQAA